MQGELVRHRFPRSKYEREIYRLMVEIRAHHDTYQRKAASLEDGHLKTLAIERTEALDECWHDLDRALRNFWGWR